jgi:hypothetical protein
VVAPAGELRYGGTIMTGISRRGLFIFESDYEERTWPELKKALDEDRVSNRPLFPE